MAQFDELLLGVWREAGRQTDITTLTANVTQLLAYWMPIQQILVRRIEFERSCLETVGIGTEKSYVGPLASGATVARRNCGAFWPGVIVEKRHIGVAAVGTYGGWMLPCHLRSTRSYWLGHWSASMGYVERSC